MGFAAKIICDSVSPHGVRLTTFEVTMPRIVLAEFNTHRMFSRNSASSRAIPVEKMIRRLYEDPYVPTSWGKNQKGMQADEELSEPDQALARSYWLGARDEAVSMARKLLGLGVHKQLTNRLLEPFMWHTAIVTATEWSNFFHLRNHPMAHPDIQVPAKMMQELYEAGSPRLVREGEWHLPLVFDDDRTELLGDRELAEFYGAYPVEELIKISAARCARVSYLTHDGRRDVKEDLGLYGKLVQPGHMSPLEHPARPMLHEEIVANRRLGDHGGLIPFLGNFRGWVQHRKEIPYEWDVHSDPSRSA